LAAIFILLVGTAPAVELQARPTARTILAAREAISQIRNRQTSSAGTVALRFDDATLRGLAALASDASGYKRLDAGIERGTFTVEASIPMPLGLWLNSSLRISGAHDGFPDYRLKIGKITLPYWAGRGIAEIARWVIRFKGTPLPPLDRMVRKVQVGGETLVAELALPRRSAILESVIRAQGAKVDGRRVVQVYCRLAALQRQDPVSDLGAQVRRAVEAAPVADQTSYNRAAFVALGLFVVGEPAEPLAGPAARLARRCGRAGEPTQLSGRRDLAKHWTLSAALGAVLGNDPAAALGEWKELSDSLASGSGFSFMDLAADRSGLHFARTAVQPGSAATARLRLAKVTDQDLFPLSLIAAQEGLSEKAFIDRYGTIEASRYEATVEWIDRQLERVRPR
jgi:hypothetical protein